MSDDYCSSPHVLQGGGISRLTGYGVFRFDSIFEAPFGFCSFSQIQMVPRGEKSQGCGAGMATVGASCKLAWASYGRLRAWRQGRHEWLGLPGSRGRCTLDSIGEIPLLSSPPPPPPPPPPPSLNNT